MTPAPLGKVVGWSASPWPSLAEIQSSSSLDGTTRPLKSHDHSGILIPAADYDRARVCVEAMEGVADPVETMRAVVELLNEMISPCSDTTDEEFAEQGYGEGFVACEISIRDVKAARALLLTLTGGRQ